MRKFLYTVGLATVILLNAAVVRASNDVYYTNLNNLEMTEKQYQNLLNQGFTEAQISRMNENEFLANKDVEATLVSEDRKYIRNRTTIINGVKYATTEILSEEEYEEAVLQAKNPIHTRTISGAYYDGTYWDQVYEMVTRIANINDDVFRYKLDIYWDTMPTEKYYDIMGIGFNQNKIHIGSSIYFREDWQTYSDVFDYREDCYPKSESTGGSVIFELPDVSTSSLKNMSQYMYFYIVKNANVGTLSQIEAAGGYAHALANYDPDAANGLYYNYTVNLGGISVHSPYGSNYLINGPAIAYFVGNW